VVEKTYDMGTSELSHTGLQNKIERK